MQYTGYVNSFFFFKQTQKLGMAFSAYIAFSIAIAIESLGRDRSSTV
jgi:hypothetical protein